MARPRNRTAAAVPEPHYSNAGKGLAFDAPGMNISAARLRCQPAAPDIYAQHRPDDNKTWV
jgi:hypothetical protein